MNRRIGKDAENHSNMAESRACLATEWVADESRESPVCGALIEILDGVSHEP